MRHARPAACFQHGKTHGHRHHTVSGIGDAHGVEALGVPVTRRAQAERSEHQAEIKDDETFGDPVDSLGMPLVRAAGRDRERRRAGRVALRRLAHIEPSIDHAQDGEYGHERRQGRQHTGSAMVPGPDAQPRPQADAAMDPKNEQQQQLPRQPVAGLGHPERIQDPLVAEFPLIEPRAEADAARMHDQQQRNCQSKPELPGFARREAQMPPPMQGVESEQPVHQK
jgi:hypothetical protein